MVGRGSRLSKEDPRASYVVRDSSQPTTLTHALRVRLLPTKSCSCGNQPADIRLIIVAATELDPPAVLRTTCMGHFISGQEADVGRRRHAERVQYRYARTTLRDHKE